MTSIVNVPEHTANSGGKQALIFDDKDFFYHIVKQTVERLLAAEMTEFLQAPPRQRVPTRRGYRSGYRRRSMKTRVGNLHFRVPCERSGTFKTSLFRRYQRTEQAFLLTIQQMYLNGVSTRKVRKLTEMLCDTTLSASTVSRLTAQLDVVLERWRKRPLLESYFALTLDARYEYVRSNGAVTSQGVLTVAGISARTGRRDLLGVYLAQTENQTSWGEVLRDLLNRGLHGVRIAISDSHEGLKAALRQYLQGVPWQRCVRHFLTNARDMVRKSEQKALTIDLHSIFDAPSLEHARRRLAEVLDHWRAGHEALADWLEENIEDCFSYFQFPAAYRVQLRTTNMIERNNEELGRRSDVIRVFPNPESCLRLMTALAMDRADEWAEAKRPYLDIKELEEWDRAASIPNPAPEQ